MKVQTTLAGLSLMLIGAVPSFAASDDVDVRREKLSTHLKSCTQENGYDPKQTRKFAKHEIAPGELKWRECAYDGVRDIMIPGSTVANAYQTLIALDKIMTREVAAGKRTRAERKKRIENFIDRTLAQEQPAQSSRASSEQAELLKMHDVMVARQRELRKMRDIQSMMR